MKKLSDMLFTDKTYGEQLKEATLMERVLFYTSVSFGVISFLTLMFVLALVNKII